MTFFFAHPWGLLALSSVGAVVFLYFFVFRGRRIEVSSLHLWQAARSLRLEGRQKRRPPITLPFIFELLAALLLSLLVAGATLARQATVRHLVVVLDSSASMSAVVGGRSFRDRAAEVTMGYLDELGADGRITFVASGFEPRVVGRERMTREDAHAALAAWRPSGPTHSMVPAVELARALSREDAVPVLLTDRPASVEGAQAVGVGSAADNAGWTSAHWTGQDELFALARHFGPGGATATVTVYGDGVKMGESEIDFGARAAVPLRLPVPEQVSTVRLELPDDALANDNVLVAARPAYVPVPVKVALGDGELADYTRRALAAVAKALPGADEPSLIFSDAGAADGAGAFRVQFHAPPAGTGRAFAGPFVVNGLHPLTQGVDLRGCIWAADPGLAADGGTVLVSVGEAPLLVLSGRVLTVNLDPAGSNVFTTPAWPVFVANVVEHVWGLSPGLKRTSFRLGEALSFYRPSTWEGTVEVEGPDGRVVGFDGEQVYYGRLEREGVYRILCNGAQVAAVDVNLLSEPESDLTGASSFGGEAAVQPAELQERAGWRFEREVALAVLALLLGCWYLLEKRNP